MLLTIENRDVSLANRSGFDTSFLGDQLRRSKKVTFLEQNLGILLP